MTYDPAGSQNRKCTCVNKRCIRSRNIRIITLTVDRLNECEIVTPTRRKWELNYYITQCTGNSISWRQYAVEKSQHPAEGALRPLIEQFEIRRVGDQTRWRQDAVEKASTQQREPSCPRLISWGSDELEIRCGRENQHPERLGPQAPSWAAQENGKEMLMAIRVGVNMLQFCLVSNSLSHTTLSNKVRGIFF